MLKKIDATILGLMIISSFAYSGCKKEIHRPVIEQTVVIVPDTSGLPANAVADASGNIYSTVEIGTQHWMLENLHTSHYSNGDPIPYVPNETQWSNLSAGAWSYFNNDAAYGELYGKLYNWYTVIDPRNVCPNGWHVPTDEDWMLLETTLGIPGPDLTNSGLRGVDANAGGQLKATLLWNSPNTGATNSSGYQAYPSGGRGSAGNFYSTGSQGYWWSATQAMTDQAWVRELWWSHAGINRVMRASKFGSSIRCVQD